NGVVFYFDPSARSMKWVNRRGPRWGAQEDHAATLQVWGSSEDEDEGRDVLVVAGGKEIVAMEVRGGKVAGKLGLKQVMAATMLGDEEGIVVFTDDVVWGYDVEISVGSGGAWRMVAVVGVIVMVVLVVMKSNGVLEEEYGDRGEEEYGRADDLDKDELEILGREIRSR
ncbi:hypothetical protein TrRE_jg1685, partial [Triparma retinervis]